MLSFIKNRSLGSLEALRVRALARRVHRLSILAALLILVSTFRSSAQYAIGGSAGTNLVNSVYWLTWDRNASNSTLESAPAGYTPSNIVNGTYVWRFSPTVRITGVITNQVLSAGASMTTYTPGSYYGDGLDLIYSGNNLPKPDSRGVQNSAIATTNGGTVTFDIDIKVAILINGVWTDVNYPGMIIADAESIDVGGEYISGNTPNAIAWQLLNKRTQGNAADDHYKMELSNGGRSFRLFADLPPGNFGVQAVMFARGARNLTNVSMKGSGITAMAIGFVLPFDLGDAPASYGVTGHYIDDFTVTDYYPGDGIYAVINYNTTPLTPKARVFIGADNLDADGQPVTGVNADNDDLVGNADESTLSPASLPTVKVNQVGDITLNLTATNNKTTPAILYGWLDFNQDGVFGADELIKVTVPANTVNQPFVLTYPNAMFASKTKTGPLYARLRITTTNLIDDVSTIQDERSVSFSADGEAEDYRLKDIQGVTISGSVVDDGNGSADNAITGTPLRTLSGKQLYAYLVNSAGIIVNKAAVDANGNYALANNNNGNYTVAISTNDVGIGGALAAIDPNLPAGWQASGAAYGTNNSGNTGIKPGTPDLRIAVSTPGTSLDVSSVNFGINQAPVTIADVGTTNIGLPITLTVTANDTDADGTINVTTVQLIDPADNGKKTTVTIPNQGTYTVNTTNGQVTFTPLATFAGKATPLAYTVKDNFGTESVSALISITIKPVGQADQDVAPINTPVTTVVKANDGTAAANATVTATNGAHGTTTVDANGRVTYTPATGYAGIDNYTYTLTTPDGVISDPITVSISIKPVGVNDADVTPINTPVTTIVKSNDGASGIGTTVTSTSGSHGTTAVDVNGRIVYTPTSNYIGKDVYTYTLTTPDGIVSDPITVNINIKPVGVNDAVTTPLNTPVVTTVKNNDGASANGTTVTPTNGLHGITTVDANGRVTYSPVAGYVGTDVYTYTLTTPDGVVSDPITVNVTIYASSLGLTKVANNGYSKVGDVINYTLVVSNTGSTPLTNVAITDAGADAGSITPATIATLLPGASVTATARHTVVAANITAGRYSNQAVANATDANGITITKRSDDPNTSAGEDPTVVNATIAPPAGSVSLTKTGVFSSYFITYTFLIRNTGNSVINTLALTDSKLGFTNSPINLPAGGLQPGATVTYTQNYTLTQADKDAGTVTNTASVTGVDAGGNTLTNTSGTVTTFPKAPVAANDAEITGVNQPVIIKVLNNDDKGNSAFDLTSVQIVTQPAHGTVTVGGDGTVTYTPNTGYAGDDVFTYRVRDLNGYYTNVATVNISISAISNLKIPNVFTPNGDGVNDVFEIRGIEKFTQNELIIVNRWGNEVFHQTNYRNTWTGEGLNEGTYYYILKVKSNDWQVAKGYVTLMRTLKR
ncbi:CshA/CshB family fibrillar adhesin-related protein [Mucilaginibacter daejeonensis]|uniref:CshA/CshB family fibrillar adhesin-related protein n=1 Tax=Mucilaginibacter daejeonensis TaxID=398049 RepID=UPI001D17B355|nr:CshA/CshB family fibrillar adhesin-related protein [Mucilaginibacter daejeonensis]UEG55055.1 CshA/CshB family fibrillar adhesin-related protein [Mucilaginibacter daejeonensis]